MPTVTAAFGLTLTNLGPLTTTFTPAPSCTALVAQSDAGYVLSGNGFSVGDAWYPYGPVACTPQDLRGCLPDGAARQPIRERNGDDQFTLPYNSPAYHCPEGWTVAATATAASISVTVSSISAAGENAQPLVGFSFVLAGFVVTALAPTETMTVCCPSGYKLYNAGFFYNLGCTSELGAPAEHSVSEWCSDGRPTTVITETVLGVPGPKVVPESEAPVKETIVPLTADSEATAYKLVHTVPNLVLINDGAATPAPTSTAKKAGGDSNKSAGDLLRPGNVFPAVFCSVAATVWRLGL